MDRVSCMHPPRAARSGILLYSIYAPCRETAAAIDSSRSATCLTSIQRSSRPARSSRAASGCSRISGSFLSLALPPRTFATDALTHQTAQVQTPSVSPDGKQIAYLSNSGGQGNIWVANADGTGTSRPLTTETDPSVLVGVPLWSPSSDWILYIKNRVGQSSHWLIKSDGSDHHQLTDRGTGASWSPDGRWVYFAVYSSATNSCIYKVPAEGGDSVRVRCNAALPLLSRDGGTLYFAEGTPEQASDLFKASPPDGEGRRMQGYAASRFPGIPRATLFPPMIGGSPCRSRTARRPISGPHPPLAVRCARSPISVGAPS